MALALFLSATLGLLLILHFWGVPAARRKVEQTTGPAAIAAAGGYAFADICRTISLLGAIATLVCLVLIGAAQWGRFGDLAQVEASIKFARHWRAMLESISPILSFSIAALCGLGLVLLGRRAARAKVAGIFAAADRAEGEQILEQLRTGSAEEKPDTAEMADIRSKVAAVEEQIKALEDELTTNPPAARKTVLEKQLDERRRLREAGYVMLVHLDIERRRLPAKPVADLIPAPKNRWERFQDVLFSRGTTSTMNGAARLVFAAVMLLLVPSLMAVATVPAGIDLQQAEVHLGLIELKLQAQAEQQQFDKIADATPPPASTTTSRLTDDQALDQLAHLYDQGVTLHFIQVGGLNDHRVSHARLDATREHIIRFALAQHPTDHAPLPALGDDAKTGAERLYLELATQQPASLSPEARRFREGLKTEIIQKRPDVWRVMKAKAEGLAQSFRMPEDVGTLHAMMVSRVVTAGLDVGYVLPPDLASLGSGIEGSVAEDSYRIRSRRAWAAILSGKNGGDVVKAENGFIPPPIEVERDQAVARRLPDMTPLEGRIAADPPRFPVYQPPEAPKVTRIVSELMKLSPKATEAMAGTLVEYDDWFPGHFGAERSTAYGKMLSINHLKAAVSSETLAKIASDFNALKGYSRVGGVLIGRGPDNPADVLDFVAITWETTNKGIVLVLTREDGKEIRFDPRPAALIAGALDYAADGRPTTVTIAEAEPLKDLKVLLHPALVDTGLGWRSIAIDRFVYDFLDADSRRKTIQAGVDEALQYVELYRYANLAFLDGWLRSLSPATDQDVTRARTEFKKYLDNHLELEKQKVDLSGVTAEALRDHGRSPLAAKTEFFESDIVSAMSACLETHITILAKFGDCVRKYGAKYDGDTKAMLEEPPEFGVRSGVRERNWSLDNDLAFATKLPSSDPLYPFDFVQQLAAKGAGGDTNPFTFPAYQPQITDVVLTGLAKSQTARVVFDDMRQFTLLQRLFRAALAGQLGPRFPVQKLNDLAKVVNAAVKASHTPRWDAHPGFMEIYYLRNMQYTADLLKDAAPYRDLVAKVASCVASLPRGPWTDTSVQRQISAVSDIDWNAGCDLAVLAGRHPELASKPSEEPAYWAFLLVQESQIVRNARQLREELGVANDNKAGMVLTGADNPPPL
jgi:hypothetical protein